MKMTEKPCPECGVEKFDGKHKKDCIWYYPSDYVPPTIEDLESAMKTEFEEE